MFARTELKATSMDDRPAASVPSRLFGIARNPRVTLLLLAAWSLLAGVTQLFVNSGLFLDIHNAELDGALGGLAFGFNAVPLALLYLFCSRDPARYHQVFWLAIVNQGAIAAGNVYHLAIGTFSFESNIVALLGAVLLSGLSFAQMFEPGK